MATFLVTGGAGFIGSNLVNHLAKNGESVIVLDNYATGDKKNIRPLEDKITILEGDICNKEMVRRALNGVDYVLHQAALPSVPRSIKDPISSNQVNVKGTLTLLTEAKNAGVKRFVFASSSSVYGNPRTLPVQETTLLEPRSPYAVTKLAGEYYCKIFSNIYGMETVSLRYFNVFGPHQDTKSQYAAVIPIFVSKIIKGERPTIFGDGEQSRDFTYIDNVVEANMRALTAPDVSGGVFNIACGQGITLNEIVNLLNNLLKRDIRPRYSGTRPGDIKHSLADITRAERLLGYRPKVIFREGLERTIDWYKESL